MYFPGATFSDAFDNFVLNFYGPESLDHRRTRLAGSGDEELVRKIEEVAESLLTGAMNLSGGDLTTLLESLESLRAMGPAQSCGGRFVFLLEAIDAHVADGMLELARSASDRAGSLVALMQRA